MEALSAALDQAERALVSGAYSEAAGLAASVLAASIHKAPELSVAAAACVLQARHLAGEPPAVSRAVLLRACGGLRAVPLEAVTLWCARAASRPCAAGAPQPAGRLPL